jgi:hypothetical protein
MKTESKTIPLMDRLKHVFLLVGLIAAIPAAASAAQFYHIDGNPASINSADGELTDDGVDYYWATKPPTKTGLARPSLITTPQFDATGRTIRMLIDTAWPPDDSDYDLAKMHYRICSGTWSQAPQVKVPNIRFCGFAMRFGADYGINAGGTGMQVCSPGKDTADCPIRCLSGHCWCSGRGCPHAGLPVAANPQNDLQTNGSRPIMPNP